MLLNAHRECNVYKTKFELCFNSIVWIFLLLYFSIVVLSWNTCFICYKAFACCFLFKFFGFFSVCLYSVFILHEHKIFNCCHLIELCTGFVIQFDCLCIYKLLYHYLIISGAKLIWRIGWKKKEPNKLKCNKNELKINAKVCLLFWNSENWLHLPKWNHYTLKRVHTILCYT